MKVAISLIQFEDILNEPFSTTAKRVEEYVKEAKGHDSKIICFPEYFWHSVSDYDEPKDYMHLATSRSPRILSFMTKLAKRYKINIIAGTLIEYKNNRYYNTCNVINSDGHVLYKYSKIKPVPYGFENTIMSKGEEESMVFELAGIKAGIIICRELFYPSISKNLRLHGAEIIFVISYWSKRSNDYQNDNLTNKYNLLSEMKVVDVLTQSRAIENEICVCYINECGNKKLREHFDILLGRTQVCYPFLGCISKLAKNKESAIHFNYDQSIILDARNSYRLN